MEIKLFIDSMLPLSNKDFNAFYSIFKEVNIKKGDYFAKQGNIERYFGILTDGVVRTFYRANNGEEHIKSFGRKYSFVGGFSSLISGNPNQINVQAITDCTILKAKYADFNSICLTHTRIESLGRNVSNALFVLKETREIELLSLTGEQRYRQFRKQFPDLENLIPQYHIASYLGITPTQLSRIRKKL